MEQLPAVTYMDTADDEMASIYVSPQVETVLGLSTSTFVTDDAWAAHLHPDDREDAVRGIHEAVRAGLPFTLEYRMIRPDGSVVWIRDQGNVVKGEDGRPAYVQGLYVDISEQKRLESELRSEAVKFKSLAEQIPAVVYIEGEGGSGDSPMYISPKYQELFGYTPEERQARPNLWRELLHPEDRERVLLAEEQASDEHPFSADYRMVARDGRIVWVHDETVPIRDESGEPLFYQGVMYDVTEQKHAEQELAQALDMERLAVERLREADDMKNTFLTAVSHDLRTPLSAILGSAITLESADELGISQEDRQQLIRSLARKARRLTAMVNDLLDMDRLTRGLVQPRRELMDLGALLGRTVAESDVLEERSVHVQAEPIDAWIDESMVVRIVENLLVNAIKHTPPTASIWVGCPSRGQRRDRLGRRRRTRRGRRRAGPPLRAVRARGTVRAFTGPRRRPLVGGAVRRGTRRSRVGGGPGGRRRLVPGVLPRSGDSVARFLGLRALAGRQGLRRAEPERLVRLMRRKTRMTQRGGHDERGEQRGHAADVVRRPWPHHVDELTADGERDRERDQRGRLERSDDAAPDVIGRPSLQDPLLGDAREPLADALADDQRERDDPEGRPSDPEHDEASDEDREQERLWLSPRGEPSAGEHGADRATSRPQRDSAVRSRTLPDRRSRRTGAPPPGSVPRRGSTPTIR